MKTMFVAAALAVVGVLSGCEALYTADKISQGAVTLTCSQTESIRRVEREKLADWGLWAKCVPAGSVYDRFELVNRGG